MRNAKPVDLSKPPRLGTAAYRKWWAQFRAELEAEVRAAKAEAKATRAAKAPNVIPIDLYIRRPDESLMQHAVRFKEAGFSPRDAILAARKHGGGELPQFELTPISESELRRLVQQVPWLQDYAQRDPAEPTRPQQSAVIISLSEARERRAAVRAQVDP